MDLRYNSRVMRIAKKSYSPFVLVLGLGLMYSQVCNVICALSNCSTPVKVSKAPAAEHSGHCSQKGRSSLEEQPSGDQHKCPAHGAAVSIPPSETISTVVSPVACQTAPAELISSFDILFDLAGNAANRGGRFRSPPRQPLFAILRI